ncbi:D-alanyl-D-alanine carboxypeptidase family protein [Roseovarius salinarum]|uniref:D-alanyl-D-alanine carboxypeptidase family protein n=1 Tax=Roseovarius salinarum TaxID=1981892 RepID=UPI000C33AA3C|nr:D-alanyl-D-alanine carboxypeptidase family protein [Roseovarius salinarum]
MLVIVPLSAGAAPYAAMVIDARNGKVLHAENADTRLHPASLTKMMTLYVVFEAVENGEIDLDTPVTVSRHAASEPPSKLGLRTGQKIRLRYLIRAAAVKSANDAATALAEAIEGSEARFARRMNRTAKAMGMTRTHFKNAHGLTEDGHLSTARDMTVLGRHLFYDYPDYYNLFSRISTHAGVRKVYHTNRRLLRSYRGADGIKTGYTRAAGFNLVASARRGRERVIATVFGGRSTRTRNAKVAELLDLGFRKAATRVAVHAPKRPPYMGQVNDGTPGGVGKVVRLPAAAAVRKSLRPVARPRPDTPPVAIASREDIDKVVKQVAKAEAAPAGVTPVARPETLHLAKAEPAAPADTAEPATGSTDGSTESRVVERVSTSSGRHWGINIGRYPSRYKARRVLLATALSEMSTLDGALRKVTESEGGFDANFMGLTRQTADLACRRLQAKQVTCFMIGPGDDGA